jgi:hypothetical protein
MMLSMSSSRTGRMFISLSPGLIDLPSYSAAPASRDGLFILPEFTFHFYALTGS